MVRSKLIFLMILLASSSSCKSEAPATQAPVNTLLEAGPSPGHATSLFGRQYKTNHLPEQWIRFGKSDDGNLTYVSYVASQNGYAVDAGSVTIQEYGAAGHRPIVLTLKSYFAGSRFSSVPLEHPRLQIDNIGYEKLVQPSLKKVFVPDLRADLNEQAPNAQPRSQCNPGLNVGCCERTSSECLPMTVDFPLPEF